MWCGWLDFHRATILRKCDGLSDDDLWRPLVPSGTNMLGLVKHLTRAEHYWFTMVFAGQPGTRPRPNSDDDFRRVDGETALSLIEDYVAECERSRRAIKAHDLDARGHGVGNRRGEAREISLRWILAHMVEETARHNGHADIIREQIDGAIGM